MERARYVVRLVIDRKKDRNDISDIIYRNFEYKTIEEARVVFDNADLRDTRPEIDLIYDDEDTYEIILRKVLTEDGTIITEDV